MKTLSPTEKQREHIETWSVVLVYQDDATRVRATAICDYLVKKFWAEIHFEFHWCCAEMLSDVIESAAAAESALSADFVVVSLHPTNEPPATVRQWFDGWTDTREERPGALVDLTLTSQASSVGLQRYLQKIAQRAGLDYLAAFTDESRNLMAGSPEAVIARAAERSALMNGVLGYRPPPGLDLLAE